MWHGLWWAKVLRSFEPVYVYRLAVDVDRLDRHQTANRCLRLRLSFDDYRLFDVYSKLIQI
jgi:hypothetical protein